jgi:hypothetical protein
MASVSAARRLILSFCLLLFVIAALFPKSVSAASLDNPVAELDLPTFISSIWDGNPAVLRGAYADGLFALPVVQQPSYNAAYVSTIDDTITEFNLAAQFGNVGFLAHNYLIGQYFYQMGVGQRIILVYGDGHLEFFRVTQVHRYVATSPYSVYSDFVDLDTQEYLSAEALFGKVYQGSRHITFQTCIAQDGDSSWGRLFVLAEPEQPYSFVIQPY